MTSTASYVSPATTMTYGGFTGGYTGGRVISGGLVNGCLPGGMMTSGFTGGRVVSGGLVNGGLVNGGYGGMMMGGSRVLGGSTLGLGGLGARTVTGGVLPTTGLAGSRLFPWGNNLWRLFIAFLA